MCQCSIYVLHIMFNEKWFFMTSAQPLGEVKSPQLSEATTL